MKFAHLKQCGTICYADFSRLSVTTKDYFFFTEDDCFEKWQILASEKRSKLPTRLTKSDFIGFCREKTDQVSYQVIPETATQTTVVQCVLFFNEEEY